MRPYHHICYFQMTFLQVSSVSKQGNKDFTLRNISFEQERLSRVAISGETGSGKSTLLKIIAGLVQLDEGEVLFEGERIKGPYDQLVAGHPEIGYLSQHFELPGFLRVEEALPYASAVPANEAEEIYKVCRIDHLLKRKTDELSGGERQRVALARILANWPDLLLLDEPFSNLDMAHKNILKSVLEDISNRLEITCMMASHDPSDTLSWADEIIVMRRGEIVQKDTPENIYHKPKDTYVAGLFGKYNLLPLANLKNMPGVKMLPKVKVDSSEMLLVRPEQWQINKSISGEKGKVQQISFFGSFFELDVLAFDTVITARAYKNEYKIGEDIFLTLA